MAAKLAALGPQLLAASKPKLAVFVKYARVELIPPTPAELPEVVRGFSNLMRGLRQRKWRQMTVKECWINTLIAVEVMCWFFAGECIGKGSIVAYKV